jgi:hypothetical protein
LHQLDERYIREGLGGGCGHGVMIPPQMKIYPLKLLHKMFLGAWR